jgi:hypothetical protein
MQQSEGLSLSSAYGKRCASFSLDADFPWFVPLSMHFHLKIACMSAGFS